MQARPDSRTMTIRVGLILCAVLMGAEYFFASVPSASAEEEMRSGMTCGMGISAAKAGLGAAAVTPQPNQATNQSAQSSGDSPRKIVPPPPGPVPEGMVWITGGEFWMGAEEFPDAQPWHRVSVDGFWMDKTEVTNDQFAKFVKATKYVTVAEQAPRAEDFPGAPPENLVAGSVVFSPPDQPVKLNNHFQWWSYVKGANWRHPEGPKSTVKDRGNYPVVHIAYQDALAYAKWAGKRLPTEAEFEFAQRGGLERKPYAWGDELKPGGKFMANTFQGHFPDKNTKEDGHERAAPVASFPPNSTGSTTWPATSGNGPAIGTGTTTIRRWSRRDRLRAIRKGRLTVSIPASPASKKKVHRGGSFLCTDQYCARYIAGGRGKGEPDTGTNHVGFRLVKSAGAAAGPGR